MLTLDVSRSMCSTDIPPNRLQAAQAAAQSFIADQPRSTQIGVVAFSGFAKKLVQAPTTDQEVLEKRSSACAPAAAPGIGNGILEALDAIAELDDSVAPSVRSPSDLPPTPVPDGTYAKHYRPPDRWRQ